MRILPHSPFEEGYEPFAREFNEELGVLDIFHPLEKASLEEAKNAPEALILRCELKPVPLTHSSPFIQLILEGEPLNKVPLYTKASLSPGLEREWEFSHYQGIAMNYAGTGQAIHHGEKFEFQGLQFPWGELVFENPFYTKPFSFEAQNYQERQTTLPSHQLLTSPPGILNGRVLRGFGGYYKPGVPLDEIQQIYYSLGAKQMDTCVRLHTSRALQSALTPPPQGGKGVRFHPPPKEEEYLSLAGILASGFAYISLATEDGTVLYHSYGGEGVGDTPNQLNIYFRRT